MAICTENKKIAFSFSDLIAGYVTTVNPSRDGFCIKTRGGIEYSIQLKSNTSARIICNFEEPYKDCTARLDKMLLPSTYIFVYAIFYPINEGYIIEAQNIVFLGIDEIGFTKQDWWKKQARSLGNFYLEAEFGGDEIDYRNYRTELSLSGKKKTGDFRQETATLSRMISGCAFSYMLTGEETFLEAAEKGVDYLSKHMQFKDPDEDVIYWYHGIKVHEEREEKLFASEFGDDFDAISIYEQIYALAGTSLTYRITYDPNILKDIELTIRLFENFYLDRENGGFFSHLDPLTLDPHSEFIQEKKGRKNWNSIGDHLPVYLIHMLMATEDNKYAKLIEYCADNICKHFPDFEQSPLVLERFMEDWSPDYDHKWQKNRGIIGHNTKIVWVLMRVYNLFPKPEYLELAKKIADVIPSVGLDLQRGGWYDAVERSLLPGENCYRFAFHDRKAWWQQEEGILAYMLLAGMLGDDTYYQIAIESAAFYNAYFLDHFDGGVYFSTLANGIPYLMDSERLKGSHAMSSCHAVELAFMAHIYTNIFFAKKPIEFYFKPYPHGIKEGVFHARPELLPMGSIYISKVWINDIPYFNFDPEGLTIQLSNLQERSKIKVQYMPR